MNSRKIIAAVYLCLLCGGLSSDAGAGLQDFFNRAKKIFNDNFI